MTALGIERRDASAGNRLERNSQLWVGRLGRLAGICAAAALFAAAFAATGLFGGAAWWGVAILLVALAGLAAAAAAAAHRAQAQMLARLDLYSQALEASSDAQLILAADERLAYANRTFLTLFPNPGTKPLGAVGERLDGGAQTREEFQRLLAHARAGRHAMAALPIREPGEASGWFTIAVHPLAGRHGYSFWRLQDITARHEMEEVLRDEQNRTIDFLDNAPIG